MQLYVTVNAAVLCTRSNVLNVCQNIPHVLNVLLLIAYVAVICVRYTSSEQLKVIWKLGSNYHEHPIAQIAPVHSAERTKTKQSLLLFSL